MKIVVFLILLSVNANFIYAQKSQTLLGTWKVIAIKISDTLMYKKEFNGRMDALIAAYEKVSDTSMAKMQTQSETLTMLKGLKNFAMATQFTFSKKNAVKFTIPSSDYMELEIYRTTYKINTNEGTITCKPNNFYEGYGIFDYKLKNNLLTLHMQDIEVGLYFVFKRD